MGDDGGRSRVILTVDDVEEWRKQRDELDRQRLAIGAQIDAIDAKLQAAAVLMGGADRKAERKILPVPDIVDLPTGPPPQRRATARESDALASAILGIVTGTNGRAPAEIRAELMGRNDEIAEKVRMAHPNYIYTVLLRMVARGRLVNEGGLYKAPPKENGPPSDLSQSGPEDDSRAG